MRHSPPQLRQSMSENTLGVKGNIRCLLVIEYPCASSESFHTVVEYFFKKALYI